MDTIKKIICLCAVLTITSSFASCGGKKAETTLSSDISGSSLSDTKNTNNKTSKITEYFDQSYIDITKNYSHVDNIKCFDNKLYLLGEENSADNCSSYSTDLDTLQTVQIENDNTDPYINYDEQIYTDKNGNTYKCSFDQIDVYDKNENLIKTIDTEFFNGRDDISTLNFSASAVSENGDIYIASSDCSPETIQIIKLNSSFEIQYITEKEAFSDCGNYVDKLFIGSDGNPVLCTKGDKTYINVLSPNSGTTTLRYELPSVIMIIGTNESNNLIYLDNNSIYEYNIQNSDITELYSVDDDLSAIVSAYIKDGAVITNQVKNIENKNILSIMKYNGEPEKNIDIPLKGYCEDMYITPDGTVYILDIVPTIGYIDDVAFEATEHQILRVNKDGTVETVYEGKKVIRETSFSFAADSKGNLCISERKYINNSIPHIIYISCTGEQTDITYDKYGAVSNTLCINDQFFFQFYPDENINEETLLLDKDNNAVSQVKDVNLPFYYTIAGNNGYDFYYTSDSNIYGYRIADGSSEKIFSWFETDATSMQDYEKYIAVVDAENIFYINDYSNSGAYEYDYLNDRRAEIKPLSLVHLKKSDESRLNELNSQNIIMVAGFNIAQEYYSKIMQYNKNHNDYMIVVTDYSKKDPDVNEDNSALTEKFDRDIASGKIPDIIIGDCSFDIQSYLSKDMLADLNDFVRNDPETDSTDLAENLLDACTYNGILYCIPHTFNLDTFTIPENYTDNNNLFTYDEFFSLSEKYNDKYITEYLQDETVKLLSSAYVSENVDFENRTCNFETDVFKKILENCKRNVPNSIFESQETFDEFYSHPHPESLLSRSLSYDNTTSEISYPLKGIPSSSEITSLININTSLCITKSSDNKEAAWEFIKYFHNTQDNPRSTNNEYEKLLSLSRSENQKTIDEIISHMSHIQDNSEYSEQNNSFDQPTLDKYRNNLNALYNGKMLNTNRFMKINDIITEEGLKYFNDTVSIDQTVSTIQSKVMLYLSEI